MACVLLASCIVFIALLSRTLLFLLPSFVLCHHQSLEAPKAQRLPFTTLGWPLPQRRSPGRDLPSRQVLASQFLSGSQATHGTSLPKGRPNTPERHQARFRPTAKARCNTDRPSSHPPTSEHPPHDNGPRPASLNHSGRSPLVSTTSFTTPGRHRHISSPPLATDAAVRLLVHSASHYMFTFSAAHANAHHTTLRAARHHHHLDRDPSGDHKLRTATRQRLATPYITLLSHLPTSLRN